MKGSTLLVLLSITPALSGAPRERARVHINDNRTPAGVLRSGVLTLNLEARVATWHPDAVDGPGVEVQTFAEVGRASQIPGPLIRVSAGTSVELSLRNTVPNTVLVVHGLSSRPVRGAAGTDSIRVPSGETRRVRFRLDAPGWRIASWRRADL